MEKSPIYEAQIKFLESIPFQSLDSERCSLAQCNGRTLAEDLIAGEDLPPYARAIVEGFIVHTDATQGASEERPVTFTIKGEVKPGEDHLPDFVQGEALRVSTGSFVGEGELSAIRPWDAKVEEESFVVTRPFPPRFFLEEKASEIKKGEVILQQGCLLGPAEIGKIASLGLDHAVVKNKVQAAIFSSGREVIPYTQTPNIGEIRDCNSIMLQIAVEAAGGQGHPQGIMPDDISVFKENLQQCLDEFDMLVISGGTAVDGQDFISQLVSSVGELVIDGVPAKSGRPLIMGHSQGKPIICVAGHPPEALRGFRLFGEPVLKRLLGQELNIPQE